MQINIPLTPKDEQKLEKWLKKYNKQRRRNRQPEYVTYQEAFKDFLKKKLRDCQRSSSAGNAREVMRRYVDLDETDQNKIDKIAGI